MATVLETLTSRWITPSRTNATILPTRRETNASAPIRVRRDPAASGPSPNNSRPTLGLQSKESRFRCSGTLRERRPRRRRGPSAPVLPSGDWQGIDPVSTTTRQRRLRGQGLFSTLASPSARLSIKVKSRWEVNRDSIATAVNCSRFGRLRPPHSPRAWRRNLVHMLSRGVNDGDVGNLAASGAWRNTAPPIR